MRQAPSLHVHGTVTGVCDVEILKVLTRAEAETGLWPLPSVLLWHEDADDRYAGSIGASGSMAGRIAIRDLKDAAVIQAGDIVRVSEGKSLISVLYRRGSLANSLFVTERCNSLCVMCSQPPREDDDSWRLDELHRTIALVDRDEAQLGFTGGEPTLLGEALGGLLSACCDRLPNTQLHVLTNGRALADAHLARTLVGAGECHTVWAVPVYGDVPSIHDDIVVANGAFEETLEGLFQLARFKARVEIRIVLHAMSLPRLPQLASFIYRRLPFVEHVAFMGIEPMGFAKANRDRLWIDPIDYAPSLSDAVHHLAARGMATSIYNLPLCVLPHDLWPYARQSISDWKNIHDPVCEPCAVRDRCAGFFLSAGQSWRSRAVAPISPEEVQHEVA